MKSFTPNHNILQRTASLFIIYILLAQSLNACVCFAGSAYANETKLFDDKLGTGSGYNPAVRPHLNRDNYTVINVGFGIVAILGLDSVTQQFIINGVIQATWKDELLTWNPEDYGGITLIRPNPDQIWRPRLALANTIGDRDLFKDDYCLLSVDYNGTVNWWPGSLFPSSCSLNMLKFPFDTQTCALQMFTMGPGHSEIHFNASPTKTVNMFYYKQNGEFEIPNTNINPINDVVFGPVYFEVQFTLARLPAYFLINVFIPFLAMSFLNIMVFAIPMETGEKLQYAITMLLTLSVFMGVVSEQLPTSSNIIPLITILMLALLLASSVTVLITIWAIWLHTWIEAETKERKEKSLEKFRNITRKIRLLNRKILPATNAQQAIAERDTTTMNDDLEVINSTEVPGFGQEKNMNVLDVLTEQEVEDVEIGTASPAPKLMLPPSTRRESFQRQIFKKFIISNYSKNANVDNNNKTINNNDNGYRNVGSNSEKGGGFGNGHSGRGGADQWATSSKPVNENCGDGESDDDLVSFEFWRTVSETMDWWALRIVTCVWSVTVFVFIIIMVT